MASSTVTTSAVERESPPMCPRVASERMNTPGSVAWRDMRMRSPRIAPPENGEVGSTATTPTLCPCLRKRSISASTSVDFPAPGLPVTPSTNARPVDGYSRLSAATAAGSWSSRSRMSRAAARTSPASTRSATRASACSRSFVILGASLGEQVARDHQPLDLVRALADLAQLGVAERALDGEVAGVAVAAVDLDRGVAGADRGLRGVQLRHRRLAGGARARVVEEGRAPDQQPRGPELGVRVGER